MARLESEANVRGMDVPSYVAAVLRQSVGTNGTELTHPTAESIASLAGTWSENEYREFCKAVAPFEQIDDELWK
jgi:hypothetical protein